MNNQNLSSFAARFAVLPLTSLVAAFKALVGTRAWNSMRASHDQALISELISRGVDVSAVYDGQSISFAHMVAMNDNKLI